MKWNIARHLFDMGCRVTILPGTATADDVLRLQPDGVFLSNGPGDPEPLHSAQTQSAVFWARSRFSAFAWVTNCSAWRAAPRRLVEVRPPGANQPVLNHDSGRVEITCQNHGFAIAPDSLPDDLEVTHINLNDNTIEGMRHRRLSAFSVQYHPEASAGPHDSSYLFAQFRQKLV